MENFCNKLPKIELHAHLNGSCNKKTINKLLVKSGKTDHILSENCDSLTSCFKIFKLLHELCDTDEAIYTITKDVIEDFANENVKYLELRTTPKINPSSGMNKKSYIESVLSAIRDSEACVRGLIIVKVIISIDRGRSLDEAWENLDVAKHFRKNSFQVSDDKSVIVGIDLSGNPETRDVKKFIPVLRAAKEANFKLTIHLGEIPNRMDEINDILAVLPDRIGHATFLLPKYEGCKTLIDVVAHHKIPIELCLTSNIVAGTVSSLKEHHIEFWIEKSHPICICTDDKGVFSTTLSKEFQLASDVLNLTESDVWRLSYESIDHIFADSSTKEFLKNYWNSVKPDIMEFKNISHESNKTNK